MNSTKFSAYSILMSLIAAIFLSTSFVAANTSREDCKAQANSVLAQKCDGRTTGACNSSFPNCQCSDLYAAFLRCDNSIDPTSCAGMQKELAKLDQQLAGACGAANISDENCVSEARTCANPNICEEDPEKAKQCGLIGSAARDAVRDAERDRDRAQKAADDANGKVNEAIKGIVDANKNFNEKMAQLRKEGAESVKTMQEKILELEQQGIETVDQAQKYALELTKLDNDLRNKLSDSKVKQMQMLQEAEQFCWNQAEAKFQELVLRPLQAQVANRTANVGDIRGFGNLRKKLEAQRLQFHRDCKAQPDYQNRRQLAIESFNEVMKNAQQAIQTNILDRQRNVSLLMQKLQSNEKSKALAVSSTMQQLQNNAQAQQEAAQARQMEMAMSAMSLMGAQSAASNAAGRLERASEAADGASKCSTRDVASSGSDNHRDVLKFFSQREDIANRMRQLQGCQPPTSRFGSDSFSTENN